MGELPFALAPEAALGAWLREAEREMEPHRTAGKIFREADFL